MKKLRWLILWMSLLGMSSAGAAPYNFDDKLVPLEMTLADHPEKPGMQWAAAEGVLGSGSEHLAVSGLSPLSAVRVFALAFLPDTKLKMSLAKFTWDETLRDCTTDVDGVCSIDFKTHHDVGIKLDGAEGTVWRVLLLTTPPAAYDDVMASPLYAASPEEFEDAAAGSGGITLSWTALIMLVIALGAVGFAVVVMLKNRRPAGPAVLLVSAALSLSLLSGDTLADGARGSTARYDEAMGEARLEEARDRISRAEREGASVERVRSRVETFEGHVDSMLDGVDAASEFLDAFESLDTCSVISNPAGMPRVPSFCAGSASCSACYTSARKDFNETRALLEQLRVIYTCTKNMTDKAIAFGDAGSNVHAVAGLAWQYKKRDIEKSVEELQNAYDNKYKELMGRLHGSMASISQCEARYGQPDWYDRFGYIYYEFMKDKYRRSN